MTLTALGAAFIASEEARAVSNRIEVLNQRFIDPLNPDPADVKIKDIAHALSNQCRFNGYPSRHYSVAEHSVYVARLVAMNLSKQFGFNDWRRVLTSPVHRRTVRQALLHDATEAYLFDMPAPLKKAFPNYVEAEERLWTVIAEVFKVDADMHPLVKEVDKRLCSTEKLILMSDFIPGGPEWADHFTRYPPYAGTWDIVDRYDVQPSQARRRFLDFFDQVAP